MSRGPVVEGSHQFMKPDQCPMSGLLRYPVPGGWIYQLDTGGSSSPWTYVLVPTPKDEVGS